LEASFFFLCVDGALQKHLGQMVVLLGLTSGSWSDSVLRLLGFASLDISRRSWLSLLLLNVLRYHLLGPHSLHSRVGLLLLVAHGGAEDSLNLLHIGLRLAWLLNLGNIVEYKVIIVSWGPKSYKGLRSLHSLLSLLFEALSFVHFLLNQRLLLLRSYQLLFSRLSLGRRVAL